MSEHITHIAVYEDTFRLIQHYDQFPEAFRVSLKNYPDVGLMCSAARGNHLFAVPFLEETREKWNTRKKGDGTEEKIAASLGWLSHRAIDLQVKPMYLQDDEIDDPRFCETEHQIYYDAITFEKVYGSGKYASVSPYVDLSDAVLRYQMNTHPAAELIHVAHLEPAVVSLIQQNLMHMRQFNATSKTPDEWLDAFPDHYQDPSEDLETYIEAFTNPDPKKMEKYVYGPNFYDEEDELISLVRDLQHLGKTDIPLQDALDKAENQSHYAQGLRRSYQFISTAADFFNKKIDKGLTYDRVEIFTKSHRK